MPSMKRALMFTAYDLIIWVTPCATESELALSGKKNRRSFHPWSRGVQADFAVRNLTQSKTILLIWVVTWKALYLVAIKSNRWFNLIFKKYDMARKNSEAYSVSAGIYLFLVLFPILISCYQLFSKYVY